MSDKGRKLYNGITNIDDDIIMAALAAKPQAKVGAPARKKHSRMYYVYRWGGVAAAVLCLAVVGILVIPQMLNGNKSDSASGMYINNSATVAESADSDYSYSDSAPSDAGGSYYGDKDSDSVSSEATYEQNAVEAEDNSELDDNQIRIDLQVADVKTVTLSYPGYDSIVIDENITDKIVELINSLGILTEKDDYLDVTEDDYATISVEMLDGQYLEITPKYPYIFIDGVPYQGPSKDKAIYNLALYINDIVNMFFG